MTDSVISGPATTTTAEGTYAVATYSLSPALGSATTVKVTVGGIGGANTTDYSGFQYRMGTSGLWLGATNNGTITLNAGFTDFQLQVLVTPDSFAETGEGVAFTVSQTGATVGIVDSFSVPAQVDFIDPAGQGASAKLRVITAVETTTAVEPSSAGSLNVNNVNHNAVATYNLADATSGDTATAGNSVVRVSLFGLGGANSADYDGFMYRMGTAGTWLSATNNGTISISATATSFQLSANVLYDTLSESGEGISFNVAQTIGSVGLTDSWLVQSTVNLADAAGQGASAKLRVITAAETTTVAVEPSSAGSLNVNNVNHNAVATYNLADATSGDTATAGNSVVRVSLFGLGGASSADYNGFMYRMGTDGSWLSATNNGTISISASETSFQLSASVLYDTLSESGEAISFNVAQTIGSVGLVDSWLVQSTVNLADAAGQGASANLRTITAVETITPAYEPSSAGSLNANNVNHNAVATYNVNPFSGAGSNGDSVVRVSLFGLGGANSADYDGFMYRMGTVGTWLSATNNGTISISASATSFQLSANVLYDAVSEPDEAISFNVAQTIGSIGLVDSWWVQNMVNLADAGAPANLRTITAAETTTASEPSVSTGNVNHNAVATYNLAVASGSGSNGDSVVRVSLFGLGGANSADYDGFMYRMGTVGTWLSATNNGTISISASATSFQLSANVLYDTLSESGEGISFNVAQTTGSIGLVDSWWVQSTVNLADAAGQGASAKLRTITAAETSTAVEASTSATNVNHHAVATYNLADVTTGTAGNSVVRVSLFGLGGASSADYNGFMYRMGTAGDWLSATNNGTISISASATSFQLSANVLYDAVSESDEAISFNVAQTAGSVGLTDSWWVTSTVNLADADAAHNVFRGAVGSDHFTTNNGVNDVFVIPAGTSLPLTGQFDLITGGLQSGDLIDLGRALYSVGFALGSVNDENAVLSLIAGGTAGSGVGQVGIVATSTDAYFIVDTNNDTFFNSGDTLIKIVGANYSWAVANYASLFGLTT